MAKTYIGTDSPVFAISPKDVPYAGEITPVAIVETFNYVDYSEKKDSNTPVKEKDDFDKAFDAFKTTVNVASITSTQLDAAVATFRASVVKALGSKYVQSKDGSAVVTPAQ
jgi:hypothetical protein